MSIRVNCPACGESYDLDDNMAGRKAACKCGENFEIPAEATVISDKKTCPECGTQVDSNGIICVQCGYNFQTKSKMGTSSSDEEKVELITKIYPFIKPAIILVVILVVGISAWLYMTSKHYGISSSNPLGTLAKLEARMNELKLEKNSETKATSDKFGAKATIHRYKDEALAQKSRGMLHEEVILVVDENGAICGVGGNFSIPSKSIPGPTGAKIKGFLKHFWREVGCPEKPEFIEKEIKGAFSSIFLDIAEFKNDALSAKWVRNNQTIGLQESADDMAIVRANLNPDELLIPTEMEFNSFLPKKQAKPETGEATGTTAEKTKEAVTKAVKALEKSDSEKTDSKKAKKKTKEEAEEEEIFGIEDQE